VGQILAAKPHLAGDVAPLAEGYRNALSRYVQAHGPPAATAAPSRPRAAIQGRVVFQDTLGALQTLDTQRARLWGQPPAAPVAGKPSSSRPAARPVGAPPPTRKW
jgi:hypothetical protein